MYQEPNWVGAVIEPPATLHVSVMTRTAAPRRPARRPSMLRELSLAAALIGFVALLAFGFSRLHSVAPGPVKRSPSPSPLSRVIPWTSATPMPLKLQVSKILSPENAAADVWQTVTGAHPVLLPKAIPSGFGAQLYDDLGTFSVTYLSSDGRKIMFSIVIPNPAPGTAKVRQSHPKFRGVQADYQVDDATFPTSHRGLMWTEPGTRFGGQPGVPYFLTTDGFTETEFWTVANSIDAVQAPVTAPACRVADLYVVSEGSIAAKGHVYSRVSLSNGGKTACSLSGFADIALVTAQGVVVAAPQSTDPGLADTARPQLVLLPPKQAAPVPHYPGDGAYFIFEWFYCDGTPPKVSAVDIALPGSSVKRRLALSPNGPQTQSRCDDPAQGRVLLMSAIQGPNASIEVAPPNLRVVALTGVPDTVIAGRTLRYTVTFTNDSGAPIWFDPCPDYEEGFTPDQLVSYQLNCVPVRKLGAGASATFAMQFVVPPKTPLGPQHFWWRLVGYYSSAPAGKMITVTAS